MYLNSFNTITAQIDCHCRFCDKRTVGCHDKCKEYKKYKQTLEKVKQNVRQIKESESYGIPLKKKKKRNWPR